MVVKKGGLNMTRFCKSHELTQLRIHSLEYNKTRFILNVGELDAAGALG